MNILKNIVRVGLIVTALSFNLVSCDYLDVVPPLFIYLVIAILAASI